MKSTQLFILIFSMLLALPYSEGAKLKSNQKRLLLDKQSKQCFFMESIKKSEKYGWLNEKKAKEISRMKRKKILTASSEVNVRKVFVPKDWCVGS